MDMELYTKRFAEYFKTARRDSGIKLDDLAVQTDLAVSTLSKIAAGGFAPACDKIVLVAHHLGINSWDWFARLDPAFEEGRKTLVILLFHLTLTWPTRKR
jgi:transcriptional regulator with XRE-family HTH domain